MELFTGLRIVAGLFLADRRRLDLVLEFAGEGARPHVVHVVQATRPSAISDLIRAFATPSLGMDEARARGGDSLPRPWLR